MITLWKKTHYKLPTSLESGRYVVNISDHKRMTVKSFHELILKIISFYPGVEFPLPVTPRLTICRSSLRSLCISPHQASPPSRLGPAGIWGMLLEYIKQFIYPILFDKQSRLGFHGGEWPRQVMKEIQNITNDSSSI